MRSKHKASLPCCQASGREVRIVHHRESLYPREREYEKRAGFVLIGSLAVHDKKAPDDSFLPYLAIIQRKAGGRSNFVKKAVNWALRRIGKRNASLNQVARETAQQILAQGGKVTCDRQLSKSSLPSFWHPCLKWLALRKYVRRSQRQKKATSNVYLLKRLRSLRTKIAFRRSRSHNDIQNEG